MKELRVTLTERIARTASIQSFRFSAKEKINFVAGQFMQVIFDENNRDNKGLNKYLSFSSSPTKDYIEFTKRISASDFSHKLTELKIGDEVLIKVPLGACTFDGSYKKIAFLIGGIGITPAISIIEYIVDKHLDTDVELFYSNRSDDDIAFRRDLDTWQKENRNIKVTYLVSDCPSKDNRCLFGHIDKKLICEKAHCVDERVFFIFGPPRMVESLKATCVELGCAADKVKTESFLGYQ